MFAPASIDLTGSFPIPAPVETAFEFFSPLGEKAWVRYLPFVGLSDTGNRDIAAMSQAAFDEKMARWRSWISECV